MITVDANEYANELERKIDMLFDAIDSDPYFSSLGEDEQADIERELVGELAGKDSWLHRTARKEFIKNPVISLGNIELEPVELSDGDYLQIRQTMGEEFRNIDSENFDPTEELIDRVAFSLIGKRYIRPSEEREELFLSDDKIYSAFSDAWVKADAAYQRSIDRLPAHIRPLFYSDSGTLTAASPGEEDKGGWISRHKKLVGGILTLLASGAAVYAYNFYNSPKQKLLRFASDNDIPKAVATSFYDQYSGMVPPLLKTDASKLGPAMQLYGQNATLFSRLYSAAMADPQITVDRNQVAAVMSDTVLDLGVEGLTMPSVYTIGNLTVADLQLGLPSVDVDTLQNLIDTTQQSPDLVDFRPVVLHNQSILDYDKLPPGFWIYDLPELLESNPEIMLHGQTVEYKSKNLARDHWLIGKLMEKRPHLAEQPQIHEWLNTMLEQLGWDMFDSPAGPGFYDGVVYSPADSDMQQIILDFNDYMEQLPQVLRNGGIEPPIPYYDSALFRQQIPDTTNRTIALMYLAHLPPVSFDKKGYIENGFTDKDNYIIRGKEGVKLFLKQLPEERDEVISSMKDPTIISYPSFSGNATQWAEKGYCDWLGDRFGWGSFYTVGQYLGFTDKDVGDLLAQLEKYYNREDVYNREDLHTAGEMFEKLKQNRTGADGYLAENWKPWQLVRYIKGHESFNSNHWGGEWYTYEFGLPIAYKALGFSFTWPASHSASYVGNEGKTLHGWEAAILGIPTKSLIPLKQGNYGKVAIAYGNGFGLEYCIEGLQKDIDLGKQNVNVEPYLAVAEIYQLMRPKKYWNRPSPTTFEDKIYLWRSKK